MKYRHKVYKSLHSGTLLSICSVGKLTRDDLCHCKQNMKHKGKDLQDWTVSCIGKDYASWNRICSKKMSKTKKIEAHNLPITNPNNILSPLALRLGFFGCWTIFGGVPFLATSEADSVRILLFYSFQPTGFRSSQY